MGLNNLLNTLCEIPVYLSSIWKSCVKACVPKTAGQKCTKTVLESKE